MTVLHFYDALTAGRSSSEGQVVRFDSAILEHGGSTVQSTCIRLRDDVFIEPAGIEYTDLVGHPFEEGISEYEWSRQVEGLFLRHDTVHIGLGSTSGYDAYIRNALYRCLSAYPNTSLPRSARLLDIATLTRAIHYLRPELMDWSLGPAMNSDEMIRDRLLFDNFYEQDNYGLSLQRIFAHLYCKAGRLIDFASRNASPEHLKKLLGLDEGALSDLGAVNACVVTHQSIPNEHHFGLFMAIAVDISYPDIVYLVDLSCDLTELFDPDTPSLDRLVRRRKDQSSAPIVRINLSRLPFVAPLATLRPEDFKRLSFDFKRVTDNIQLVRGADQLVMRLLDEPIIGDTRMPADVDYRMLAGEYHDSDLKLIQHLHTVDFVHWPSLLSRAHDNRILELGRRILLRHRPDVLSESERRAWKAKIRSLYCGPNVTPDRVESVLKHAEDSVVAAPGINGPVAHITRLRRLLGQP